MELGVGWLAALDGPLVRAVLGVGVSPAPAVEILGGLEDEVTLTPRPTASSRAVITDAIRYALEDMATGRSTRSLDDVVGICAPRRLPERVMSSQRRAR